MNQIKRTTALLLALALLTGCGTSAGASGGVGAAGTAGTVTGSDTPVLREQDDAGRTPGPTSDQTEEPSTMPMPMSRDPEAIEAYLSTFPNSFQTLMAREDVVLESVTGPLSDASQTNWDRFLSASRAGEEAAVILIRFTTEGDAILYYLHFDGGDYYLMEDTTRDAFGTGAYNEFTFRTLEESHVEYGLIQGDRYEKHTTLVETLTDPVSAAYPAEELPLLYALEKTEDMGIMALPEPTRDEAAVKAYLASFPEDCTGLPEMDGVVTAGTGSSDDRRYDRQPAWDLFSVMLEEQIPVAMTYLACRPDGTAYVAYVFYDGTDIFGMGHTPGSRDYTAWTSDPDMTEVKLALGLAVE